MKRTIAFLVVALCCSTSFAGVFDYQMSVSDADATEGLFYDLQVTLTHATTDNVGGWSFSVCHDNTKSDVCTIQTTDFALNLGIIAPLFFLNETVDDRAVNIPGSVDGAAQGVVIDSAGFFFFPAGQSHVVADVTYVADPGTAGTTSTTSICSTVGNPPIEAVIVCCAGTSVPIGAGLEVVSGTVTYLAGSPLWRISGSDFVVDFDAPSGVCATNCTIAMDIDIMQTVTNLTLSDTAGFAVALNHDSAFLAATGVTIGAHLAAINGAGGPDILLVDIQPDGVSVECLNTDFPPPVPPMPYVPDLLAWTGQTAFTIDYTVDTTSLAGATGDTITNISFGTVSGLSTHVKIQCSETDFAEMNHLDLVDMEITLNALINLEFVRGDCNDTGAVNIADPIWLINGYLAFPAQGPVGPCAEACDANNDDTINVADVSFLFSYLFLSGTAPSSPFPSCGTDVGAPCDQYFSCP